MTLFRLFIAAILATVLIYTAIVVAEHGLGLFPIFFGDILEMGWPGQFNLDFLGFLSLSGLWLAWRNEFSPLGCVLGVLGFFGGVPVLSAYLLYASFAIEGDVAALLLGEARAQRLARS